MEISRNQLLEGRKYSRQKIKIINFKEIKDKGLEVEWNKVNSTRWGFKSKGEWLRDEAKRWAAAGHEKFVGS